MVFTLYVFTRDMIFSLNYGDAYQKRYRLLPPSFNQGDETVTIFSRAFTGLSKSGVPCYGWCPSDTTLTYIEKVFRESHMDKEADKGQAHANR